MLIGGTPQMVAFDNPWRPTTIDGFMCVPPVDNDGAFAPSGEPGLFITINDDAIGGSFDALWIYELDVDWISPSNSTFTRVQQLAVPSFDSNFGNSWNNIVQPSTSQKLDAIPMVVMNRPQYRNFGSYETIVCCHTVDVDATNHAGIRWYELRRNGGNWSIRQSGTYAPDEHNRWIGSVSLNGSHQIGLAYSISSATEYPGIRFCGQSESEYAAASGILDIAEEIIQTGNNSQVGTNRWGDYADLSVDPDDVSVMAKLTTACELASDWEAAVRYQERMVGMVASIDNMRQLARYYSRAGRQQDARARSQQAPARGKHKPGQNERHHDGVHVC